MKHKAKSIVRLREKFLHGVPNYLESTRSDIRILGMYVAQLLSSRLTPETPLKLLDTSPVDLEYLSLLLDNPLKEEIAKTAQVEKSYPLPLYNPRASMSTDVTHKQSIFYPLNIKDNTPRFISQCISFLNTNDPATIELALKYLDKIISRASELEVSIDFFM